MRSASGRFWWSLELLKAALFDHLLLLLVLMAVDTKTGSKNET